jgi:hypothetical protein
MEVVKQYMNYLFYLSDEKEKLIKFEKPAKYKSTNSSTYLNNGK